ncbi:MAG TPA: DUF6789 family protein [Acidimicrobiales bacterium]|nr:DUF6789 family protein [Acidimicrobiales bacterium]
MPRTAVQGMVAGAVATVPMSAVMLVAGRTGAMGTQPPEQVAEKAMDATGVDDVSESEQNVAASLAHVAFGAGGGAAFALAQRRLDLPVPTVVQGVVFGLAVWATSYQGWIPALRILPPADDDRPGRRRAMIAAHIVYGGVLGAVETRVAHSPD